MKTRSQMVLPRKFGCLSAALGFCLVSINAQETDRPAAPRAAPTPAVMQHEIDFLRNRLQNLRQEEQAWQEKSATAKELETMRARIAETEAKLKEWENRKAHAAAGHAGHAAPKAATHGHDTPKDAPKGAAHAHDGPTDAAKDTPAAERLQHLRTAIEHLHSAGMHEQAHELTQKAAEIERAMQTTKDKPAVDRLREGATQDGAPGVNRFLTEVPPPPYSNEAPKPLKEWLQPLDATADAKALFEKRILPIFHSAKASSCTECHLSGLDLKDYIFPDQEKTFAALIKGDLINTAHPDDSKILEFISRRPHKPGLIGDAVRQEEFTAFRAWIHAAVKDPKVLAVKPADVAAGPQLSAEVIRHARTDRVFASFLENVWVEMNRCASCHSPEKNQRQVEKHGEQMTWIKPGDPLGTLQLILDGDLLNFDRPERSALLTKPTLEKEHKGGQKMLKGDRAYLQFLTFAKDYSGIGNGNFAKGTPLPKPTEVVGRPIQTALRITNIPPRYARLPLQADIYAWTDAGWSQQRAATAAWNVMPKNNMWQFVLTRLVPRTAARQPDAFQLKPGKYLVKIYVDEHDKLKSDPLAGLGDAEFIGQVEVETPWKIGPPNLNATIIQFPGKS